MEEINFRQLCKNLKRRGYEPAEKGVSDFVEEYEKLVFSVEPKNMRLKDIIKKIKDLSDHTRAEWIDGILQEFGNGFGSKKWREGYEQGKFEGEWVGNQLKDADKIRRELNRPVVPQFVADWIGYERGWNKTLHHALENSPEKVNLWLCEDEINRQNLFARAWLFGYEVEKEKRYTVKIKAVNQYLVKNPDEEFLGFLQSRLKSKFTRKELEDAGVGWVFNCEGIEIEEVEE